MAKKEDIDPKVAEDEATKKDEKLLAEAKALGITRSKIEMSGFHVKGKPPEPDMIEKEEKKQNKMADERLKNRVEQARLDAKKKPIEKRKALIVSRFKAVKSRFRPRTYSEANLKAWLEELDMINNSPKSWVKITRNGTVPFVPGNRKKKTARDRLDEMDLD